MERIIAHLDLDAFFASVEERENPRLKGLPIVVGADPMDGHGRGVVSTANYAARSYGIRSALPISKAWEFSEAAFRQGRPRAVFLTGSFRKYAEVSRAVMEIIRKYSDMVEGASIDEAYIDLSFISRAICGAQLRKSELSSAEIAFRKAKEICRQIKKDIFEKEKLTASVGLGSNKLVAKIASDMQKPDGLMVIYPELVKAFLEPLSIRKIPGIGPKTEQFLNAQKIFIVKDLKKYSQVELQEMLGKWGVALYDKIRGLDDSPVAEDGEVKSIGEQVTFQKDTLEFSAVIARLEELCAGVFHSFQRSDFKSFRTIVITVRFADFATKTRSHTLIKSAETFKVLKVESIKLLMPFFDARENSRRQQIRLIGVRIEKLK